MGLAAFATTRRRFLLGLGVAALALALPAEAQQKVHRIGILPPGPLAPRLHLWNAFREGLRELGYVEGRNVVLIYPSTDVAPERLREHAAELVRLEVDVIVAATTTAVKAAEETTRAIPIVFPVALPVETGLAASFARPGGNTTGITFLSPETAAKRLELLKALLPKASRMAVLSFRAGEGAPMQLAQADAAARALGLELLKLEAAGAADLEPAFVAARDAGAAALVVLDDPLAFSLRRRIVALAGAHRLPAIYGFREFVDEGGLLSYAPNLVDMYRRSASFVDRILKGAKPHELPIERPNRFELVVNLKAAHALDLEVPRSVLLRADEVIR